MVTIQRFKFNSRSRQEGESVATFVAALRHLAIHCEYGVSLSDMLRDRLICGVNDDRIQRRLLAEAKIDFTKALAVAQAMETAESTCKPQKWRRRYQRPRRRSTTRAAVTQSVGAEVAVKTVTGVAVNTDPPLAGTWRLSAMPVARKTTLQRCA